jgi:hypothetical protein
MRALTDRRLTDTAQSPLPGRTLWATNNQAWTVGQSPPVAVRDSAEVLPSFTSGALDHA